MTKYLTGCACCFILLLSVTARAADTDSSTDASADTAASVDRMGMMERRLNSQEQRISELESEREAAATMAKQHAERTLEIEEELDATRLELDELASQLLSPPPQKKLEIYGFFDTTFYKAWYGHENSVLKSAHLPYSTFMMSHVNLYFSSQMSDTLSALVETGFSFSPLGFETNVPVDAYSYNEETGEMAFIPGLGDTGEYERVDTMVPGGITSTTVRYGSVSIVRAYLDWGPREWLNFRVGQYLTPYGIWNVEHASTVLLGVYYPNLMHWDLVPASQLGVQAFGRIFPSDYLQLSYALTLSNGRGPTSTVMDWDENKGMGARLQLDFTKGKLRIVAGSYGYFGKYSDGERRAEIYLNSDLTRHYKNGSPLGSSIIFSNKYSEYIITFDLEVALAGFEFFGEAVHRKVDYIVHAPMHPDAQFVQTGTYSESRRAANHFSQSAYGILAYRLPISAIAPVKITPYVGVDWLAPDDPLKWFDQTTLRGGVNVKPSPFVAIKAEGIVDKFDDVLGGKMTSVSAQLAVSF
ncbi:MAG: hypothetical protein JXX14_14090 [Deltaproteobacteria bacterium]|nr:hypothetical protein [Deltaproteobacteria bacterium]